MPLVSIITINFNQSEYTIQMIESLKQCNYNNIEIIVVDNASTSDNVDRIKEIFPEIILLKLTENLGFAGGNNKGLALAKGEYFLLLNNDTEVIPNFLQEMIAIFEQYPDAGMVSPRLNYFNSKNKKTIQFAGARKISVLTGRGSNIGWGEIDNGQYNYVRESEYAHGAALMFNYRVLNILGCMPDQYFLYYEEHDWCTAMRKRGLKAYYCGTTLVYHKESISVGKNSLLKTYYMNRNRIMYLRRNANFASFIFALMFYLFVSLPVALFRFVVKKEYKHIKHYLLGIVWHFAHFNGIKGFPALVMQQDGTNKLVNESDFYKEHKSVLISIQN